MSKNIYQYKYLINGIWRCSSNHLIIKDNCGNVNNLLDLTKANTQSKILEKNEKNSSKNKQDEPKKYRNKLPNEGELLTGPDSVSELQVNPFPLNLRSNQYSFGNQKYLNNYNNESYSTNTSYKPLLTYDHINLEHIFSSTTSKNSHKISLCFRYREKASTIIYYSPKLK